jgi:hypothetical protein
MRNVAVCAQFRSNRNYRIFILGDARLGLRVYCVEKWAVANSCRQPPTPNPARTLPYPVLLLLSLELRSQKHRYESAAALRATFYALPSAPKDRHDWNQLTTADGQSNNHGTIQLAIYGHGYLVGSHDCDQPGSHDRSADFPHDRLRDQRLNFNHHERNYLDHN